MKGDGVDRKLFDRLLDPARTKGADQVVLSAQTSASAFSERAGFSEQGQVLEEAAIRHIEMSCSLQALARPG